MALPIEEIPVDAELEELLPRGLAIYEQTPQPFLEPEHNGEVVAIHPDSGDYAVAATSGAAMRAMRQRHPTGQLLLHTIGPVTDPGLASRMLGRRPVAGRP